MASEENGYWYADVPDDLERSKPTRAKDLPKGFLFQVGVRFSRLFENVL